MLAALHPTKRTLVETAVVLLETMPVHEITSDLVLERSGISKGSLYHHFEDFPDLLEFAQVFLFSTYVDSTVTNINQILHISKSREDLVQGLKQVTRATQAPELTRMRNVHIQAISNSLRSERTRNILSQEQERITEAIGDLFRESQERGWGNPTLTPRAFSVFVQSYTIGRVIDDFASEKIDPEQWIRMVDLIFETLFFPASELSNENA